MEVPPDVPRISNVSEDPFLNGRLQYGVDRGDSLTLGCVADEVSNPYVCLLLCLRFYWYQKQAHADVILTGTLVDRLHCKIENIGLSPQVEIMSRIFIRYCVGGTIYLEPLSKDLKRYQTFVNGAEIKTRVRLAQGARVWFGPENLFVFEDPTQGPLAIEVTFRSAYVVEFFSAHICHLF